MVCHNLTILCSFHLIVFVALLNLSQSSVSEFHLYLSQFVETVDDLIWIDLPFSDLVFAVIIDGYSLLKYHFYIAVLVMDYCEFEWVWEDLFDDLTHVLYLFFSIFVSSDYLNNIRITLSPF